MYIPLVAANKTAFPKIVSGKTKIEIGEITSEKYGIMKANGAKGKDSAKHISAFESAPPNIPK